MAADRTIVHVDLDAYYASVEQRDNPDLRGRPVIVGGDARRGVVTAASYEARPFGVRSAMPMARALQLCPGAVVVAPRMAHYAAVSRQFFDILGSFTPLVEGLSLDEAFLDVTAVRALFGDGRKIAETIKRRVREDLALVASVGVAPNKFVAKIGSDLRKPDGLVVVAPDEVVSFLHPLEVSRLWGVGRVTGGALAQLGIATIGDVAETSLGLLQARVGDALGLHLYELANGRDDRCVEPEREAVSVGHEDTFGVDIFSREKLLEHLLDQGDRVAARLRAEGLRARVITVKVKYANHARISRRQTLAHATADGNEIARLSAFLLGRVPGIEARGVRLTGVSASGLESTGEPGSADSRSDAAAQQPAQQLGFAGMMPGAETSAATGERLGRVLDRIRSRFGSQAVRRGVHVDPAGDSGESG